MPRLFAALEIPHEAVRALNRLRGIPLNLCRTEPADYHITLRFYGDMCNGQADALVSALDGLHCAPFSLRLKGLGVFTPKKPRRLYAGVENSAPLAALQAKIEHISRRAAPPETRKFTPHVTLARLRRPEGRQEQAQQQAALARYLAARGDFASPVFPVRRFCLMSSRESVGGGPYIIEEDWPLRAK